MEMLLVLFCVSFLTTIFTFYSYDQLYLNLNMDKLKNYLVLKKRESQIYKYNIYISIKDNQVYANEDIMYLSEYVNCDDFSLYFNKRGNVNMGGSIVCEYKGKKSKIIINLGSGNIYVQ